MSEPIVIGYQAFVSGNEQEFGAVRAVSRDGRELTIYVENAGDFTVSADAVLSVRSQKVTFDGKMLDAKLRNAIGHAHDQESE